MRKQKVKCPNCNGTGKVTCNKCAGTGCRMYYKNPLPHVFAFVTYSFPEAMGCYSCNATGKIVCKTCKGSGEINKK